MFSNPFNSKFVSDVTKFLVERRDRAVIDPCLDGAAKETAIRIASEPMILEDRRIVLRSAFNEAVTRCGCKGSTDDANDFAGAVERHSKADRLEEAKRSLGTKSVVPGKPVKIPSHKASELATPKEVAKKVSKSFGEESVGEGFAQPTDKELKASVKWLRSILKDPRKLKDSGLSREDAEDNLAAALDMLAFGKKYGSKVKESFGEESIEEVARITNLIVLAAYGRTYGSAAAIKADLEADKDFIIQNIEEYGRSVNLSDMRKYGTTSVTVYYGRNNEKVTAFQVSKLKLKAPA